MTPSQFARDFLGLTLEPWQADAVDRHYRLTAPEGLPAVDLAVQAHLDALACLRRAKRIIEATLPPGRDPLDWEPAGTRFGRLTRGHR